VASEIVGSWDHDLVLAPSIRRRLERLTVLSYFGTGGRRFKSSLPDQSFLESINYEHKKRDFGAEFGSSKLRLSNKFSISNQRLSRHSELLGDTQRIKSSDA